MLKHQHIYIRHQRYWKFTLAHSDLLRSIVKLRLVFFNRLSSTDTSFRIYLYVLRISLSSVRNPNLARLSHWYKSWIDLSTTSSSQNWLLLLTYCFLIKQIFRKIGRVFLDKLFGLSQLWMIVPPFLKLFLHLFFKGCLTQYSKERFGVCHNLM